MKSKMYEVSFFGNFSLNRLGAIFLATLVLSWPGATNADVVSDWNETAESIFVTKSDIAAINYALVHLAIYDAVNAIERRHKHTVYAVHPTSTTTGASQLAAAASAAYTILSQLYPDQAALLDQAYANSLVGIRDGTAKTRGIAVGEEVAMGLLELRQNDGRNAIFGSYTFTYDPGDYMATPPGFPSPIAPALGNVKPFALKRASQFRAEGPPDLTSSKYWVEFREVKALGSATSTVRTPEQTETAMFYFEGPTTFWTRNYRTFIRGQGLSINDEARLYAMLSTAYADALIGCWDSKYYYNAWRPVSAIQNADIDRNPSTVADPNWEPLGGTPPHPEYPSAHACNTSAMNTVLGEFYGTRNIPMTLTSLIPDAHPRHFDDLNQQLYEVVGARIWAGFHFRSANVAGVDLGSKVGTYIANNYFLPVD
jgi:hypothetical protein